MACLEMYNNSHSQPPLPPMSPRISFSNDFVESHNHTHHHHFSTRSELAPPNPPPASSDFEFSITNSNTLTTTADELFSKGRLLPFKENGLGNGNVNVNGQRTLRDELLVSDDDVGFSLKPPKGASSSSSSSSTTTNRWKGFLGLRKSHIGSKKPEKIDLSFDSGKRFSFSIEDPNLAKSPQEMVSNEGSSSSDMEMGI